MDSNDYITRHNRAMDTVKWSNTDQAPVRCLEKSIAAMVKGLRLYEMAYKIQYAAPIADDGVLGPAFETIAHALRGLLNGEIGRLDGGLTDKAICEALESAGFNPDVEGERNAK